VSYFFFLRLAASIAYPTPTPIAAPSATHTPISPTSQRGTPVRQSNFQARHFKPAALRAGLDPKVRFHDLQHSYAAMLIAEGVHPRAIMERLGHSSIQVTLDTYGHLFPELEAYLTERPDGEYRRVQGRELTGRALDIA